jgi:hypothetical protein
MSWLRGFFFILFLAITSCQTDSQSVSSESGTLRHSQIPGRIVNLTAEGIHPATSIPIPENGVIYFYNQNLQEQLSLEIQVPSAEVVNGETTQGFFPQGSVYFTRNLLAPGTVVTISFNQTGLYPFVVYGLQEQPVKGEIEVQRSF